MNVWVRMHMTQEIHIIEISIGITSTMRTKTYRYNLCEIANRRLAVRQFLNCGRECQTHGRWSSPVPIFQPRRIWNVSGDAFSSKFAKKL